MSVYDWIVRSVQWWSRRSSIASIKTHSIYLRPLAPGSVVVDLGANVGEFTQAMSKLGCECHAVEAMPGLFAQIAEGGSVRKYNIAIAERDGPLRIYVSSNRECNSVFSDVAALYDVHDSIECTGTTLEGFIKECGLGRIDLLKVDIEGAEAQLFRSTSDATLSRIGQITIEFHDFIPNTIRSDEVRQIRRRLERLGFTCLPFSYIYPHEETCDFLFVSLRACPVPLQDRLGFAVIRALLNAQKVKARLRRSLSPPA